MTKEEKKYKYLVTGSAGFLGSHLVNCLESLGLNVYGIDDLSGGFMHNVKNKRKFTKLDLRNRLETEAYINKIKPDVVFHLAADATEGRSQFTPFSAIDRNLGAYMNLLVPCIKNKMRKMILTSSMSVYGAQKPPFKESMDPKPEDVYASSKTSMEVVTKVLGNVHGFDWVVIRPHNVFGKNQNLTDPYRNVIGIFINRLLNKKPFFIYGDGEQVRAFSYVDDVIPPMVTAAFSKKCLGQTINIGGELAITLNDLGKMVLHSFFGCKPEDVPEEFKPKYMPARPQEVKVAYSDHSLAKKLIGFRPKTSIKRGLEEMIKWAKKIGPQKFVYLDSLELENENTPKTWKDKLI